MGFRDSARLIKARLRFLAKYRGKTQRLWKVSVQREPDLPLLQRLRYTLKGHDPLEASWYHQAHGSLDGCVSRYDRGTSLRALNSAHKYYLKNKLAFAEAMTSRHFPHPTVYGFTHNGSMHWLGEGRKMMQESIMRGERIVLKPLDGSLGQGIEFITNAAELDRRRPHDFLLSAFVTQAEYAARIFPHSTNTIRVLTVTPHEMPVIAAAAHRFGVVASGGVDNFHAGGINARIDLKSGRMGKAVQVGEGNRLTWLSHHPETKAAIEGVAVPHWPDVKDLALRLARSMPFLPYVGWDIAVTESGPVVIEGNGTPGADVHQFHAPLLDHGPARQFYERHIS